MPDEAEDGSAPVEVTTAATSFLRARNYLRHAEHPSVVRALTPEPKQTIRVFYNVYAPLNNRTASKHAVAIVDEQFRQLTFI